MASGNPKAYPPGTQLKGIVTPHEHDVLSGRGNFVNYHTGNEHFRALVKKHKIAYVACPKPEKGRFSIIIVDEIRSLDPPGRFLKQDATTKLWEDIGDKKSLDKTRQALREGAPELLKELAGDDPNSHLPVQPPSIGMPNAAPQMMAGGGQQQLDTGGGGGQHTPDQQQYFMQQMAQMQAQQQQRQQAQAQQIRQPVSSGGGYGGGNLDSSDHHSQQQQQQQQQLPLTPDQLRAIAAAQQSGQQIDLSSFMQRPTGGGNGATPASSSQSSGHPGAPQAQEPGQSRPLSQPLMGVPPGALEPNPIGSPETQAHHDRLMQQQQILHQQQQKLAQQQALLRHLQEQQRQMQQAAAQSGSGQVQAPGASNMNPGMDPSLLHAAGMAMGGQMQQQLPENVASLSSPAQGGQGLQQGQSGPPQGQMNRRGSLTFDDLVKGIKGAKAAQKMGMSSTNMSLSVCDVDSNLSSAFEDSLIISVEGSLENSSNSEGRGAKKPGPTVARTELASKKDPNAPAPVQTVAVGGQNPNSSSQLNAALGESGILRGLTASEAAMSFSLSDAADLLGSSAMQMSYRSDNTKPQEDGNK